jgi:uncharacterized protein YceK
MRALTYIAFIVTGVFAASCSTANKHLFEPNSNPVYGGTRDDCHNIAHNDSKGEPAGVHVWAAVDLPFSFVADTLLLPFDLIHLSEQPPSIDPLKGWKNVGGSGILARDNWPPQIETNIPFGKIISDDVTNFVKTIKNGPGSESYTCCGGMEYYEDGAGRHAIKIKIPLNGGGATSEFYILIYDKDNVRNRVIKYREWTGWAWRT